MGDALLVGQGEPNPHAWNRLSTRNRRSEEMLLHSDQKHRRCDGLRGKTVDALLTQR